jgi:hypothetical protein
MFEQAVLPAGPPSRRCWAMAIGVTGEVLVVVCALIHPGYLALFPDSCGEPIFNEEFTGRLSLPNIGVI